MSERQKSTGSWVGGVRSAGADLGYPGERLGLPSEGPGALGAYGRRLIALFVDWVLSLLVAEFFVAALGWDQQARGLLGLAVFGVQAWLLTGLTGATAGKRLCRLCVVRLDGAPVGVLWSLVRAVLLVLVIPALLWDRDYRGLHDRAANTVVVRA